MPTKKRKRTRDLSRKAVALQQKGGPIDRFSLLANPADLRGLEIFLTQTRGFRLALALHDDMWVRDQVNGYLQEKLQASGVDLLLVDLRTQSLDTSLLGSAAAAFASHTAKPRLADGRAALALVNLENRVSYNPELANGQDQKSAYLATANLQRDLWSTTFNGPVLIWMSELLEPAMAKWAPDLWHWRSHVFDLRRTQSEKVFDAQLHSKTSRSNSSDDTRAGAAQRLPALQNQLDVYRKAGKREDEARLLDAIGFERLKLGEALLAAEDLEAALAIALELGDKRGEGRFLGNLGAAWSALGESPRAIGFYEKALAIAREMNDKAREGSQLGNLGNAWAVLDESRRAIGFYEQALAIAREIGDKRGEGTHLGNLGNAWAALGESRRAISFYEQALVIAREVGYIRGEGNQLANMGNAWLDLGEPHRAIEFCEQALVISREIGDKRGEGANLGNQGRAWATLGELPRAIEHYEQALIIFREIGDKRGEGKTLFNLAVSLRKIGNAAEKQRAIALAEEALAIFKIIEWPRVETVEAKLAEWQAEK